MTVKSPHRKPVAIIAARGRSKGIPRKNLRWIAGQPLISHTIQSSMKSGVFENVFVTSDDEAILGLTSTLGAIPLQRPRTLAGDRVPLDPVIEDALHQITRLQGRIPPLAASIQPTSPLLKPSTFRKAFAQFMNKQADTLFCVREDRHLRWEKHSKTGTWMPLFKERVNRQQLPLTYRETGGIVLFRSEILLRTHTRFGRRVMGFEISPTEALDIDTLEDLILAEYSLLGGAPRRDSLSGLGAGPMPSIGRETGQL